MLSSITRYLKEKLRLKVNESKSAVVHPWERKFLGYSMTSDKKPRLKVSPESLKRLKAELKGIWRKGCGMRLEVFIKKHLNPKLRGWINHFSLCEVKLVFEELDGWIRRHLRKIIWLQLKKPYVRFKVLRQHGLGTRNARMLLGMDEEHGGTQKPHICR